MGYRSYSFRKAFSTSLESIVNTFDNLDKELDLYTYDDFIEKDLEDIAKKYKENSLPSVKFELVCLIAYNETKHISGSTEAEIKDKILSTIIERCNDIESSTYTSIKGSILERINYIIFPIWKLDDLLDTFETKVGSKS